MNHGWANQNNQNLVISFQKLLFCMKYLDLLATLLVVHHSFSPFDLEIYSPVSTVKAKLFNLLTLFLGRFSPLSSEPVLCAFASNWQ